MTAKDAIRFSLKSNRDFFNKFLADFTDADMLVRPVPGANHAAWQVGQVVAAEVGMILPKIPGAKPPALPLGFVDKHGGKTAADDTGFWTKAEYMDLYNKGREASLAALELFPDADLDKDPQLGWGDMVPNFGAMFLFLGMHDMMHAGQFSVIRRKLGKPVLF